MAKSEDRKKQLAEDYYIQNHSVNQKEVAELFQVTEKTLGKWLADGNWKEKRFAFHSSPVKIKELLQTELLNVSQGKAATLNADGIAKLMSALDKIERKANPIVVSEILKALDNFISEIDPAFAIKCTEFHKKFLQYRINLES
jgi:transposase